MVGIECVIFCRLIHFVVCDVSGRVSSANSIFIYLTGETYSGFNPIDFTPLFLVDILANMTSEQLIDVETTCKSLTNKECIFDYYITGKL